MSHTISISSDISKEEKYQSLIPQIQSLVSDEKDIIANFANICAALKYNIDGFFWVGFYFNNRIKIPDGVCGTAVKERKTIIVDDINNFPGHIACSPDSKSEIVIPIFKENEIFAVLDIDSDKLSNFDEIDKNYLEQLAFIFSEIIK